MAQTVIGQPFPWEVGLQAAGADRMRDIIGLHNFVLYIITVITLFVGGLLVWIMVRYNARANPVPSATTHNTVLEVLWTIVPVLILVAIAIPSFRLLYYEDTIPNRRYDDQSHRQAVVLDLSISGQWKFPV